MADVKYPKIRVKLTRTNGNAYAIMGKVRKALRDNGVSKEEITKYVKEAQSGDYYHLLGVSADWVNVS